MAEWSVVYVYAVYLSAVQPANGCDNWADAWDKYRRLEIIWVWSVRLSMYIQYTILYSCTNNFHKIFRPFELKWECTSALPPNTALCATSGFIIDLPWPTMIVIATSICLAKLSDESLKEIIPAYYTPWGLMYYGRDAFTPAVKVLFLSFWKSTSTVF